MFKFSQRSIDRMAAIHPDLRRVADRAIQITLVDFGIPEFGGRRTADEQRSLFDKDLSKADGTEKLSFHQTGDALDFYAIDPATGKASWDGYLMTHVAAAFLQAAAELYVRLEWGGFWHSFKDMPHIQRRV